MNTLIIPMAHSIEENRQSSFPHKRGNKQDGIIPLVRCIEHRHLAISTWLVYEHSVTKPIGRHNKKRSEHGGKTEFPYYWKIPHAMGIPDNNAAFSRQLA